MKQEKIRENLKKSCAKANLFARFISITGVIAIAIAVLVVSSHFTMGKCLDSAISNKEGFFVQVEGFTVNTLGELIIAVSKGVTDILLYTVSAFLASDILKSIAEDGIPFKRSIAKKLKKIGTLIILDSFVPVCVASLVNIVVAMISENAVNSSVNLVIDLNVAVSGALLYILSNIFSYGTQLQQESDDTV